MSLVGRWPFEGNTKDRVGGYDGTTSGSPTFTAGKIGECIDLSGTNGWVDVPDMGIVTTGSISLWFRKDNTDTEYLMDGRTTANWWFLTHYSGHDVNFVHDVVWDGLNTNQWYHAVVTITPDETKLYIDGDLVDTGSGRTLDFREVRIGARYSESSSLNGKIDDVRLYDHALSKKEVQQLSQAKVLHYKFNEDNSTVADASGHGNTGALNGPTYVEDNKIGSGAYDFSGSSGIRIENNPVVQLTGDLTISFWAKPFDISSARQNPINKDYSDEYTMTAETDGDLSFYFNDSDSSYNNYQADNIFQNDNEWVHVTAVRDVGNEVVWYRNGEYWQTESWSGGDPIAGGNDLIIGDGYTNPYNGILDDVRFYASALSQSEIQEIYQQRGSIDDGGDFHSHEINGGEKEGFESGSFTSQWDVSNASIFDTSYSGNHSFGNWDGGGVEATWNVFDGERQIDSFEYIWIESGNNSGHVVALRDRNGNVIQESGTENPQWYLNNGSGGRFQVNGYDGTYYDVWTRYRFDFNWDSGTYDYYMEKLDGSHSESGTADLESTRGIESIRIAQGSSLNYYGNGDNCRFDQFKINDTSVKETGVLNISEPNEVGPAPGSLVGWWPLDGDVRDYSGKANHGTNNGASVTGGLGQSAYDFDEGSSDNINISPAENNITGFGPYTISAWVKFNSFTDRRIVVGLDNGGNDRHSMGYNDSGEFGISHYNGSYYTAGGGSPTNIGDWYHLVGVGDGSSLTMYVNAIEYGNNLSNNTYSDSGANHIGYGGRGSESMDGKIQDVRIYNRALTDSEIATLYNMTDPRTKQQVSQHDDGTVHTKNQFSELL